ncbi:mobilization protein [Paraflavisolibacter sp. H34]|uniref:plasmid mobilization protein n=1 Tax=Huijunlia imazamoxiresistens TaxID=3127457 RepID=UPI00301623E7
MKNTTNYNPDKGGRPRKAIPRNQLLGVKCSLLEKKVIEHKARAVNLTVSEFLRELGLKSQVDRWQKVLPKEVLLFQATLNHLAANLNQIAKKRNSNDELNALERAELLYLSGLVKQLAGDVKNYLR